MGLFNRSNTATVEPIAEAAPALPPGVGMFAKPGSLNATPATPAAPATAPAAGASVSKPLTAPPRSSRVASAAPTERQVYMGQLKVRIHQQLVERLDMQGLKGMAPDVIRLQVRALIKSCARTKRACSAATNRNASWTR